MNEEIYYEQELSDKIVEIGTGSVFKQLGYKNYKEMEKKYDDNLLLIRSTVMDLIINVMKENEIPPNIGTPALLELSIIQYATAKVSKKEISMMFKNIIDSYDAILEEYKN